MKFGEYLLDKNVISESNLSEALEVQKKLKKKKLGRLLVELGIIEKKTLNTTLFDFLKPKINDVFQLQNKMKNLSVISDGLKKLAKEHKAIIVYEDADRIEYLKPEFFDDELLERSERLTNKQALCWTIGQDEFNFLIQGTSHNLSAGPQIVVSRNLSDDEKLNESTPYAKLFKEILNKAKEDGASDIHIEPTSDGVNIRFRCFGTLSTFKVLGKEHREGFISKIKSIVNMDLAIVGRPQDARASFKVLKTDIRANSLPNLNGEKIVLRLLDQARDFRLESSGLSLASINALRNVSKRKDGLVLISGPTGSGKTSTLYSLLYELPRDRLNVSTLENPVEYQLESVNQVNIKDDGVSSFESSLRALMRQDPDVILVGEIRDQETASLAFKAASTGHLVFSTVHANGAKEVVERLINLGVDIFTIKSNLRLSAAQRLIPLLCPHCSVKVNKQELESIQQLLGDSDFKKANPQGCPHCRNGIGGRTAILEFMTEDEIKQFLDSSNSSSSLPQQSLKKEACELIQLGKVDFNEIYTFI